MSRYRRKAELVAELVLSGVDRIIVSHWLNPATTPEDEVYADFSELTVAVLRKALVMLHDGRGYRVDGLYHVSVYVTDRGEICDVNVR